jgi:hypothetical protein
MILSTHDFATDLNLKFKIQLTHQSYSKEETCDEISKIQLS